MTNSYVFKGPHLLGRARRGGGRNQDWAAEVANTYYVRVLCAQRPIFRSFDLNVNFNLGRGLQKISYERAMSPETTKKKKLHAMMG